MLVLSSGEFDHDVIIKSLLESVIFHIILWTIKKEDWIMNYSYGSNAGIILVLFILLVIIIGAYI